jgi:hypothetical protein
LEDVEAFITSVRHLITQKTDQQGSAFTSPLDAVYKTMRNINYTALAKSTDVDHLLQDVNGLMEKMGLDPNTILPQSATDRALEGGMSRLFHGCYFVINYGNTQN